MQDFKDFPRNFESISWKYVLIEYLWFIKCGIYNFKFMGIFFGNLRFNHFLVRRPPDVNRLIIGKGHARSRAAP